MRCGGRVVGVTFTLSLLPWTALAQSVGPYVNASGTIIRLSSEPRYSRIDPPVGGVAPGLTVSVGTFLTTHNAIEAEVSIYRTITRPKDGYYFYANGEYRIGHHDLMLNGLLRSRFSPNVELVLGGGIALTRTTEKQDRPGFRSAVDHEGGSFMISGGLDGVVPARRRIAVVPSFRLRWIHRPESSWTSASGVGNFILQFGVGIRGW